MEKKPEVFSVVSSSAEAEDFGTNRLQAISQGRWTKDRDLAGRIGQEKAATRTWKATALLSYTAIGVALGDLGTSPIYTLSSVFDAPPSEDEVLGAVSIIFWALTLIVIVKYQLIALRLNDHGEGGTFALYSLIARYCGFTPGLKPSTPDAADLSLERYSINLPSRDKVRSKGIAESMRKYIRQSPLSQLLILLLVLLMTSLVIGDGVLTPAQTVLGAFGALQVKAPSLHQSTIAGISMAVLGVLFLVQPLGTHRIGFLYAPVLILWFFLNCVVGIHNIAVWYPGVWKAVSPYYLYVFFRGNSNIAWQRTATCFLALTGAEASYADLGHFTPASIRIAFLGVLYPSVVLAYFGQAAWIVGNPQGYATSFFSSIPWGNGFFYLYFVTAVGAACVASQTMISAAFSIVKQSVALHCFPRVSIKHTSRKVGGQVWIPVVTVFMMAFTIAAVGIFQNSVALGFSYGVCVSTMMLGTDFLIAIAMIVIWELPIYLPLAYIAFFGFIDGVFFSANLTKIPKGGWFALVVASIVSIFTYVYFMGTALKRRTAIEHMEPYTDVIVSDEESKQLYQPRLASQSEYAQPVVRLPGAAFFYTEHVHHLYCPAALKVFVRQLSCLHETVVLITVRQVAVSVVFPEERLLVRPILDLPGVFHVVARYGYAEKVEHLQQFAREVLNQVQSMQVEEEIPTNKGPVYVAVDARLKARPGSNVFKKVFIESIYSVILRILATKAHDSWHIPGDSLLELRTELQV